VVPESEVLAETYRMFKREPQIQSAVAEVYPPPQKNAPTGFPVTANHGCPSAGAWAELDFA